jgi:hypothetical protein
MRCQKVILIEFRDRQVLSLFLSNIQRLSHVRPRPFGGSQLLLKEEAQICFLYMNPLALSQGPGTSQREVCRFLADSPHGISIWIGISNLSIRSTSKQIPEALPTQARNTTRGIVARFSAPLHFSACSFPPTCPDADPCPHWMTDTQPEN